MPLGGRCVVQKFGGTSLGSAERIQRVADVVRYARPALSAQTHWHTRTYTHARTCTQQNVAGGG
jgi:hypothetical protein